MTDRWRSRDWSAQAGWALRCIQIAVIFTYFLSALTKIRSGGWSLTSWPESSILLWAIIRRPNGLGQFLIPYPELLRVMQWGSFIAELTSVVVLWLRGRALLLAALFWLSFHLFTVTHPVHPLRADVDLLAGLRPARAARSLAAPEVRPAPVGRGRRHAREAAVADRFWPPDRGRSSNVRGCPYTRLVAGRINEEDVAAVRDRARIEEVVGSYVTLRTTGGTMKGLCPFHDEKTPSFQVTPSRGYWYCFGACAEGGDVIDFMRKIDNLTFVEAVERLADRVGIQLRYTDDGGVRAEPGLRMRLVEALKQAADFYAEQLTTPEAQPARQFLAERGFDRAAAEHFGVGFAPRDGRALLRHLRGRGFADKELVAAGLAREAGYDFFQSRALWPIRDSGKQVLGFGARRLFDDDRMPAKYINTPETVLYKKSHVLYGLDLARTAISKKSQAVVVEGYTDVMAAHLAGVDTAVASCGTAFGDDHARLLRRLMGDHDAFHGEVIFTFDGDAAGQAAALKVFAGDQNFVTQTYVAIEPTGLDPCDLRLQRGDAAVRELVARRLPLYRFVMSNVLSQHDLDRADGRLAALRAATPLVASIRDTALVSGYVRELAGLLGMDIEEVRAEVMRAAPQSSRRPARAAGPAEEPERRAARPAGAAAARPAGPAAGHRAADQQAADPEPGAVPRRIGTGSAPPTSPIPRTPRSSPRWRRRRPTASRPDDRPEPSGCTGSPRPARAMRSARWSPRWRWSRCRSRAR